MDKPKAPDDDVRGWTAIEIYLFTNGQEYSPPRKYHLKTEQLRWWDAALGFLARSQFGSLHSNIELYTLDGKKITTPLDLMNDAAYVAVKPPDAFVQTGYEKYLLRASRSWEKRHEKFNNTEIPETENNKENREQAESNLKTPGDTTTENRMKNEDDLSTEKPELLQRRNPESNTKSTIFKKIYPHPKSKEDGHAYNKKRTTSFPKTLIKSSNNSKRLTTSSNNTNILKSNVKEKPKAKDEPQSNNTETSENIPETNKKIDPIIKNSSEIYSKDFTVISDVYKNAESDIQSVFLDEDQRTALLCTGQKELPRILENIHEFRENPKTCLKTNEIISQRSASNLSETQAPYMVTQGGTLNINLNIDIKGYNGFKTDEKFHTSKCKTFITHIKPEKASQVNVNINLSRETLNFGGEVLLHDESLEVGKANTCDRKIADNNTKVIVHCKCNVMKPEYTPCDFNDTGHYIFVIPNDKFDKFMSRSGLESRRGSDKDIQELLHSCIGETPNSELLTNKNPVNSTGHKVSISQNAPLEFNSDSMFFKSQGDTKQPTFIDDLNKSNYKIENFTQTDWSNILLQVKCHKDGRYTFNLPPLHLLAQYNLL